MRTERFDFDKIVDQAHFYRQFSDRFALADRVINNLDDLLGYRRAVTRCRWKLRSSIWGKGKNAAMVH